MIARLLRTTVLVAVLGTLATSCADQDDGDEFAVENTSELADTKADLGGTYTYYKVSPDPRRCAAPRCGGFWVERVNRTTTKCGDGTFAERCYVAEIKWSQLGLADATRDQILATMFERSVVMRATVGQKSFGAAIGKLGELRPTEAWLGQGPNPPSGPFVKVEETGVRCFAAPCPSFREKKLNDSATATLAELGWDHAGATDEQIGNAITELFVRDLIIAGDRYTVRGPAGTGKARTVTQFYTRARDKRACFVGGCSSQVCSDRPGVITTCEYRPEFACYADATCEEQVEGECGWTPTAALDACLANPPL